jgi:hypothetical protein
MRIQPFAAHRERKAVAFPRLDFRFDAIDLNILEQFDALFAFFCWDASRASVGNQPFVVDRAKVATNRNVTGINI